MRYVLGPAIGPFTVSPEVVAPAPEKTDVIATLVSHSPAGVVLGFPAYDSEKEAAPDETRVYALPAGFPAPKSAGEWADFGLTFSASNEPVPPDGVAEYVVSLPAVPKGDYVGQVIHCFKEAGD